MKQKNSEKRKPRPRKSCSKKTHHKNQNTIEYEPDHANEKDVSFQARILYVNEMQSIKEKDMFEGRFFEITLAAFDGDDILDNDIPIIERLLTKAFPIYFEYTKLDKLAVKKTGHNKIQIDITYIRNNQEITKVWNMV